MDPALRLTRLSELGNGVTLYGLQYPGFSWLRVLVLSDGRSWSHCRHTARKRGDCGTSITNIWDEYSFLSLQNLPEVATAGPTVRWFEHYYGTKDPEIDEVFLTQEGRVNWKFGAKGIPPVAMAFERLTDEPEPDFAATGFEDEMMVAIQARRTRRM